MPSPTPSLSYIGNAYVTFAKQFYETEPYDLTPLLDYLPDLKLDSKYVLEDFRPRKQTNSVLWLYVRDRKTERLYDDTDNRKNPFYVFGQNWNKCYASKLIKIAGIPIFRYKKRLKPIKRDSRKLVGISIQHGNSEKEEPFVSNPTQICSEEFNFGIE